MSEKSQEVTQQENNSKEISQPSEGMENLMAPYYGFIDEVRVLLVDHDKEFVFETVDFLESYKYKVTTIDLASAAMSMLSKGKGRFDIMIMNVHSPDLQSFQLLAQAVALDIVSIFVCDEHHTVLVRKVLDIGAYLYLKKPLHEEFVKYMWQFVLRERLKKEKEREERTGEMNIIDDGAFIRNNIVRDEQVGLKIIPNNNEDDHDERDNRTEVGNNINVVSKGKYKVRRSKRGRKITTTEVEPDSQSTGGPRRKVCTEWTVELHAKFMKVVRQLGEGRCYPKEILEMMNVPGLTRMQVASHLQKCRNNNWRIPEARKVHHPNGRRFSVGSQQRVSQRKFGSMPRLQTNFVEQQHQQPNQDQSQRVPLPPEFVFPPPNNNNIFVRGESSTEQQVYRPQLVLVEPHYVNIGNSVSNPLLSHINAGGLQQHAGGPYGIVDLGQGGQVIDESIVYTPGLGDHVHNDCNMNATMGHGTYSESAMISDTNENETIDTFLVAAENANFQQLYGEHNLSDPSMNIVASHASDSETGSDERTDCDEYFDFNDVDYLFQNLGPPDNDLPKEQCGNEFDQVYSDDQVAPTPSIQFPRTTYFPGEQAGSEFDQVYSDDQVAPTPSVQFPAGTASFPDESR